MIDVKNLCAGYDNEEKLHGVSCKFKKGEITVLIGPNGCGKSTLLKAISGVLRYESGSVVLDGVSTKEFKGSALAKKLAYLPQNRNIPSISAQRMVLHGRFPYLSYPRRYRKEDYEIARNAMEQTGTAQYADVNICNLSGGERQKVYLAMALAQNTPVVLLDEPTTYLDIYQQLDVLHMVQMLKEQGKTVIMVLHDLNLALQCADRIVVMQQGEIVTTDKPDTIVEKDIFQRVFNVTATACKTQDGEICYFFKR